jgi:hypothetical protein
MSHPGPRCPGCGYPIFGLRDMRCPECGRTLDVRDFNIDMDDAEGHQRRLRRDGRIGVGIGLCVLLIPTALFALIAGLFIYERVFPPCVVFMVVVMFIWVWRVLAWIGREAMPAKKRRP